MPPSAPDPLVPGGRFAEWAPAPPRLALLDVDGTVLADGPEATGAVVAGARRARAAGVRVGLATGRLPAGIAALSRQLDAQGPHVVHNGAQVVQDGRALWTAPLAPTQSRALVEACAAAGVYAEFYARDQVFVTDRRPAARPIWRLITGQPDGLVQHTDLEQTEIIKATIVAFAPSERDPIVAAVRELGLLAEVAGSASVPTATFVNAVSPLAGKGAALLQAAEHLHVPPPAVIAVGDGPNDISMLALAGTAVAMGDAPAAVRSVAHLVAPDVRHDGAAHVLEAAARWRERIRQTADDVSAQA